MNWDAIFWVALALVGTGLVVGGGIAYRSGKGRALPGAAVAVGLVMWGILLLTLPVSSSVGYGTVPFRWGLKYRLILACCRRSPRRSEVVPVVPGIGRAILSRC